MGDIDYLERPVTDEMPGQGRRDARQEERQHGCDDRSRRRSRPSCDCPHARKGVGSTDTAARSADVGQEDREEHEGHDPGKVEVEPVGEDELEAGEQRPGERRQLERAPAAREEGGGSGAREQEHLQDDLDDVQVGDPRARGTGPSPRARTGSAGRAGRRSCGPTQRARPCRATARGAGSRARRSRLPRTQPGSAPEGDGPEPRSRATGAGQGGRRTSRTPPPRGQRPSQPPPRQRRNPRRGSPASRASFVLTCIAYVVNGNATQPNASGTAMRCPPRRSPATTSPARTRRSKAIAAAWAAQRRSHRPDQPSAATNGT